MKITFAMLLIKSLTKCIAKADLNFLLILLPLVFLFLLFESLMAMERKKATQLLISKN